MCQSGTEGCTLGPCLVFTEDLSKIGDSQKIRGFICQKEASVSLKERITAVNSVPLCPCRNLVESLETFMCSLVQHYSMKYMQLDQC